MSTRVTCVRCRRPEPRCVCGLASAIDNRTGVTILQHPAERHHAFNTARLVRSSLRNSELHVLWPDAQRHLLHTGVLPPNTALLYPRHDAVELSALPVDARPRHLVVIDGTWAQARVVYRDNPWLEALPHVQLSPVAPSRYRIRREPAPHCLSTIESIASALAVLEPDTEGLQGLLDSFIAMVDAQADQSVLRTRRRKVRQRPNLIARLALEWDRIVIGYAEVVGLRDRGMEPLIAQWAALRPSTGEVFDAQLEVAPGPATRHVLNAGLDPARACSRDAFVSRWTAFAGPNALVVCWSPRAVALLALTIGRPTETLSLRSAYGNIRSGIDGCLDEVTAREGCLVSAQSVSGRAADRLGHALALTLFLKGLHRSDSSMHPNDDTEENSPCRAPNPSR